MFFLNFQYRALYHYIAEATFCQNDWYRELENPEVIEDVSEFIEKRTNNHEVLPIPAGFGEANESVSDSEPIESED